MTSLHWIAWASLAIGLACAIGVAADIAAGRRQPMAIMNLVWPITCLYASVLGLWAYLTIGRPAATRSDDAHTRKREGSMVRMPTRPFWQKVVVGTLHCGAGCTLGDILAEWFVVLVPLTVFGVALFGTWTLDFAAAFAIGIAFQYFAIKPMRKLGAGDALRAAFKADAASLTAWQVGMYGAMALAIFAVFDRELPKTSPVFWFVMQVAMLCGFVTALPVNAWLIKSGIKEAM